MYIYYIYTRQISVRSNGSPLTFNLSHKWVKVYVKFFSLILKLKLNVMDQPLSRTEIQQGLKLYFTIYNSPIFGTEQWEPFDF